MDTIHIAQRLKKYLFLVSIIFLVLTATHSIYSYISHDAKKTAMKGGSFSEAVIGNVPNMNPLRNITEQNKYINSILYRSLLKYDTHEDKIVSDLAKCDISNLLEIECFITETPKWSNGESISYDDIEQTFHTLKTKEIDPNMFALLQNTTIEKRESSIVFKNTKKDINFLKIFFQPIVSNKVLSLISKKEIEGSFSLQSGVFSGLYIVSNITEDQTSAITTITLSKNLEYPKNPAYIETIFIKVFPNVKDFLKNKGTINVFNDKDNIITGSIPRLEAHDYTLPQYVSVFFNTKKITDNGFRAFLSEQISPEKIISELGKERFKEVYNPFMTEEKMEKAESNFSLQNYMKKKSYFTKEELLTIANKNLEIAKIALQTPISGEAIITKISDEAGIEEIVSTTKFSDPKSLGELNPKSSIITSPNWVERYNFISNSNTLLIGKVPAETTAVYINDYKVQNYIAGKTSFNYRISTALGTLKNGDNSYKIFFESNGEKKHIETINFHLNTNKTERSKIEKSFLEKLQKDSITEIPSPVETAPETVEEQAAPVEETFKEAIIENTEITVETAGEKVESNNPETSTGSTSEQLASMQKDITEVEKKLQTIQELSADYYYDTNFDPFSLELYVLSGKKDHETTAEIIKQQLKEVNINVEIREITQDDLSQLLSKSQKNYDMILAGIHLSYFDFNIYAYFHETQIEKKYNFSNFRSLDLDILLEELKSKLQNDEKIASNKSKIISIINKNNLVKTIYTPVLSNLVDKSIKGYELEEKIPEKIHRFAPFQKSYIQEERSITTQNKDFGGYVTFLFTTLFGK